MRSTTNSSNRFDALFSVSQQSGHCEVKIKLKNYGEKNADKKSLGKRNWKKGNRNEIKVDHQLSQDNDLILHKTPAAVCAGERFSSTTPVFFYIADAQGVQQCL
jgi:hypothetical protein